MFKSTFLVNCHLILIFCACYSTEGNIDSRQFENGIETTRCGHVVSEVNVRSRIKCSDKCLAHNSCKGMFYNAEAVNSVQCKLVTSYTGETINQTLAAENNYTSYSFKISSTAHCTDLGINVTTPTCGGPHVQNSTFPLTQHQKAQPVEMMHQLLVSHLGKSTMHSIFQTQQALLKHISVWVTIRRHLIVSQNLRNVKMVSHLLFG